MARRFSTVLGITHEALDAEGAFDGFVDVDSKFYIDPHLLQNVTIPELATSHQNFRSHFADIFRLLKASKSVYDVPGRTAVRRLISREISYTGLGYSAGSTRGSAIGQKLARQIANTASEIIKLGIEDPELFELLGLIEDGIAADRISDMTTSIILLDLLRFTERIATKFRLRTRTQVVREQSFRIPYDPISQRPILLIPKEIIRPLPIAYEWSDIDVVCAHNAELRRRVNQIIGSTWKQAVKVSKLELKALLLTEPEVLQDLIDQYKLKPTERYNFERDAKGEIAWYEAAQRYSEQYPLELPRYSRNLVSIIEIVTQICNHFKVLVEDNGLYQLLYDQEELKHERAAQLLFFGIADAYCSASNLDLSREVNGGRGAVDFKISRGYNDKVNVEIKYSTNNRLRRGYTEQLPAYDKAERALHSIFLIIKTNSSSTVLDELHKLRDEELAAGRRVPDIIVVDGRSRPSASNL